MPYKKENYLVLVNTKNSQTCVIVFLRTLVNIKPVFQYLKILWPEFLPQPYGGFCPQSYIQRIIF